MTYLHRIILATIITFAAIGTTANAQPFSSEVMAGILANDETINGIMHTCADWIQETFPDVACFWLDSSFSLARSQIEYAADGYSDMKWGNAWGEVDSTTIVRMLVADWGQMYGIIIEEIDSYRVRIIVVDPPEEL